MIVLRFFINSSVLNETIEASDLETLLDFMEDMAHKWFAFGVMLNITPKELDRLQAESKGDNQQTLRGVMERWMRGTSLPATWPELINMLHSPMVGEAINQSPL